MHAFSNEANIHYRRPPFGETLRRILNAVDTQYVQSYQRTRASDIAWPPELRLHNSEVKPRTSRRQSRIRAEALTQETAAAAGAELLPGRRLCTDKSDPPLSFRAGR